ncbi:hypothetical protein PO909_015163 [Leuciscus waleckii]
MIVWTVLAMVRTTTACRAAPAMEATIHIPTDYRLTSARPYQTATVCHLQHTHQPVPAGRKHLADFHSSQNSLPSQPLQHFISDPPTHAMNTHKQAICGFSKNMWCGNAVLTCLFCSGVKLALFQNVVTALLSIIYVGSSVM